jgi:hypothetical protein
LKTDIISRRWEEVREKGRVIREVGSAQEVVRVSGGVYRGKEGQGGRKGEGGG